MARLAWVTMTRVTADRQQPVTPEPRVDAGVKELNEMTIGRTDDPENPRVATARASRIHVWDWIADPIWASGHGAASTGRTHDRDRPARQISHLFSCTQGAVHTCTKAPDTRSTQSIRRSAKPFGGSLGSTGRRHADRRL